MKYSLPFSTVIAEEEIGSNVIVTRIKISPRPKFLLKAFSFIIIPFFLNFLDMLNCTIWFIIPRAWTFSFMPKSEHAISLILFQYSNETVEKP